MQPRGFDAKRRHLPVIVALIAVAAGTLASRQTTVVAAADGGAGDLAVGSAVAPYPSPAGPGFSRLSVSAHSDAWGLNPGGDVRARGTTGAPMGAFEVSGPVTCLRVEGNRASIKYRFSEASGSAAAFKGGGVEVFITDNGPPRHGQPVDEVGFLAPEPMGLFERDASRCDDPTAANYEKVTSGNYTVRDSHETAANSRTPR